MIPFTSNIYGSLNFLVILLVSIKVTQPFVIFPMFNGRGDVSVQILITLMPLEMCHLLFCSIVLLLCVKFIFELCNVAKTKL